MRSSTRKELANEQPASTQLGDLIDLVRVLEDDVFKAPVGQTVRLTDVRAQLSADPSRSEEVLGLWCSGTAGTK